MVEAHEHADTARSVSRQYTSVEDEKHFLMECPAYQDIRYV
jgi:hypothetical protein